MSKKWESSREDWAIYQQFKAMLKTGEHVLTDAGTHVELFYSVSQERWVVDIPSRKFELRTYDCFGDAWDDYCGRTR